MHRITLLFALTVLVGVSAAPAAEPLDNLKTLMPKDLAEKVTPKVGIDFWPGIDGELRMVTSTKVNGKGSITEALGRPGKAIIAVMADIDLEGQTIGIPSEVTLTGRFADMPPQILRGQVVINSSNVRVDQLAFRPGDLKMIKAVWEPVSLMVTGKGTKNVVISNCSLTWGVDGNAAVMSKIADGIDGAPSDVLFYRCLIGQSLHRCPTHRKNRAGDGRSCGLLINDFCQRVGVVECIFADNYFQSPMIKPNATVLLARNLIANPGALIVSVLYTRKEYQGTGQKMLPPTMVMIENMLVRGKSTSPTRMFVEVLVEKLGARAYTRNNTEWNGSKVSMMLGKEIGFSPLTSRGGLPLNARQTEALHNRLLEVAGAHPTARHTIDATIITGIRKGTGTIIDSQDQVGGYPKAVAPDKLPVLTLPEAVAERTRWVMNNGKVK